MPKISTLKTVIYSLKQNKQKTEDNTSKTENHPIFMT